MVQLDYICCVANILDHHKNPICTKRLPENAEIVIRDYEVAHYKEWETAIGGIVLGSLKTILCNECWISWDFVLISYLSLEFPAYLCQSQRQT